MKIILKPMGVISLGIAIVSLGVMAARKQSATQPTPGAVNAATPPAVTAPAPETIVYDDTLRNNWANFTWGKNDFTDAKQVPSGKCVRVESGAFEALYFHHEPMSVATYDRLTFRIHGGTKGGQTLKLVAQMDEKGTNKGGTEYVLPSPIAGKWSTVTLTLQQLGVAGKTNFVGFWLQEGAGNKAQPAYYVDDVRFLRPGDPAPAK